MKGVSIGCRTLIYWFVAGWCLLAPAAAEIVVLDNGRFLRVSEYEVRGDDVRLGLESGGELIMPLLRIDRVIADEIQELGVELETVEEVETSTFYLGFGDDAAVPSTPFGEVIFSIAKRRNVSPRLVAAVIRAESAFDPMAVSRKGARGLMQLMPATGKRFGVNPNDLFDAEINIEAGIAYLEDLIERYYDDLSLVLAAYNAGEGAVAKHNGVPPYRETREYIRRIYGYLGFDEPPAPASGK